MSTTTTTTTKTTFDPNSPLIQPQDTKIISNFIFKSLKAQTQNSENLALSEPEILEIERKMTQNFKTRAYQRSEKSFVNLLKERLDFNNDGKICLDDITNFVKIYFSKENKLTEISQNTDFEKKSENLEKSKKLKNNPFSRKMKISDSEIKKFNETIDDLSFIDRAIFKHKSLTRSSYSGFNSRGSFIRQSSTSGDTKTKNFNLEEIKNEDIEKNEEEFIEEFRPREEEEEEEGQIYEEENQEVEEEEYNEFNEEYHNEEYHNEEYHNEEYHNEEFENDFYHLNLYNKKNEEITSENNYDDIEEEEEEGENSENNNNISEDYIVNRVNNNNNNKRNLEDINEEERSYIGREEEDYENSEEEDSNNSNNSNYNSNNSKSSLTITPKSYSKYLSKKPENTQKFANSGSTRGNTNEKNEAERRRLEAIEEIEKSQKMNFLNEKISKERDYAGHIFFKFDTERKGYIEVGELKGIVDYVFHVIGVDFRFSFEEIRTILNKGDDGDGCSRVFKREFEDFLVECLRLRGIKFV